MVTCNEDETLDDPSINRKSGNMQTRNARDFINDNENSSSNRAATMLRNFNPSRTDESNETIDKIYKKIKTLYDQRGISNEPTKLDLSTFTPSNDGIATTTVSGAGFNDLKHKNVYKNTHGNVMA